MDGFETHVFSTDGIFPNSRLPVLIYRAALAADAEAMIRAFAANVWIDGIFPYHHFHSIAHEALGIAAGSVDVLLVKATSGIGVPTGARGISTPPMPTLPAA